MPEGIESEFDTAKELLFTWCAEHTDNPEEAVCLLLATAIEYINGAPKDSLRDIVKRLAS